MIGGFLRVAWHVMRKDLTVEVRSLEIVSTTLFCVGSTRLTVSSLRLAAQIEPAATVTAEGSPPTSIRESTSPVSKLARRSA